LVELIINEPDAMVRTRGLAAEAGSRKSLISQPNKFPDGEGNVKIGELVAVVLIKFHSYIDDVGYV